MRRWLLVTGAGKRLGRAVAESAAKAGWAIAVHYNSSAAEAEETVAAIRAEGGDAILIGADLSDAAAAAALISEATTKAGAPISGLVNAAAIFEHDLAETFTPAGFHRHMEINALAPVLLAQALAAQLPADAHGVIINFLDFKLAQPYPDHFTYTLSKYALMGATEMLARGLAPRLRVNAVSPGYVLPAPGQAQADFERLHAQTPLARGATAADVAAAVAFLLANEAVSGQTIFVDAGLRFETHAQDFAFR